ncbi:MAG: dihydropteroate synthase [Nitrospirae bacterium CG18_big_fil_WC_8_21_14_2_50_70_55]|nr:dihydropteroate synthase [Deltaproteobacteria bacterium]PIQ06844.1 MAG: dihydropteroate synthase [Nitrospirae bacterium CG18_big_fil_WC_8_21_14_2_50_70_55]PIU79669.1 MAG: dihydropteroate synthase [Nitrospirae bacterium CG06_land_8_20_14_3_00_70_43]PIW83728.1 MAG: dihydropteroate synthase [Nitrospirae bacterium CG_4_8_14_3_um_filter_70_85]PIX83655.1 MAG: dihydropteroate synthase [Nitrospirae bacterium CG_4_10_14_3_um_filter_70_108]PJB96847.1 MAG: dihydropteroate synthase [Nitrospirae bacteri
MQANDPFAPGAPRGVRILHAGPFRLALGAMPLLMGVVNVTPDSFSDGGRFLEPAAAIAHGVRLAAEGAAILDLGAESTRPGAAPVPAAEQLRRLLPVVRGLAGAVAVPLSIDTTSAAVAEACLAAGATMVNDISGLTFDPRLAAVVAAADAALVVMHCPAPPLVMQAQAVYRDVVAEVCAALAAAVARAAAAGISRDRLLVDPGLGFGKTAEHNWEILRHLDAFEGLGWGRLVGASRKSFIGLATGAAGVAREVSARLEGSLAVAMWCALAGVEVVRVHDVDATAQVLKITEMLTS